VIILDNYPVHKAKLAEKACEILNIVLIPLPPYSPKLNPIEQVWRTVKKELSTVYMESKEFLQDNFEKEYYNIVDNVSFYETWLEDNIIGYSPEKIH
jgi:transposase